MEKKLKKSKNKMLTGVAGGIAEYFGIDATIVRILFAVSGFFGGAGIVIYIICLLIMQD